jgi:hypothetical protein
MAGVLNVGVPIGLDLLNNSVVVNVDAYELDTITDRGRLSYELDVMVFNGVGYDKVATIEADEEPVQRSGDVAYYRGAFFEIDAVLKGFLDNDWVFRYNGASIEVPDMTVKYYTVVRIYVDGDLEETITNPQRWGYKGGVSEVDYERWKDRYFTGFVGEAGRLLTNDAVLVSGDADVAFVAWIHNYSRNIGSIKPVVRGLYAGGLTIDVEPVAAINVNPMGVYAVPVGGDVVLGDAGLSTEDLVSWQVWLEDQNGDRVSEVAEVLYDGVYRRQRRSLVYLNGMGVPVAVTAVGQGVESVGFERTVAEEFRGFGYEAGLAERKVELVEGQRVWLVRMAAMRKHKAAKLLAVGYSKNIWVLDNGQWLPVVLRNGSMVAKEDAAEWMAVEFELELAYKETSYSELPEPAGGGERETGWRPLSVACDLDARDRYYGKLKVITLEQYYLDNGEAVKPRAVKPNKIGDRDYVPMVDSAGCAVANTPFRNTVQSRAGSFLNQTCGAGLVGAAATITVAANSWGSLVSVADANAKALAEIAALDTQAYANANGPCNTVGVYDPGVIPSGRWYMRGAGISGLDGFAANEASYRPGNMWFQGADQQPDQTDVHFTLKFDRHYPVLSGGRFWQFQLYGDSGKSLRFFRNGLLVGTVAVTSNDFRVNFPANPANGERWWMDVV